MSLTRRKTAQGRSGAGMVRTEKKRRASPKFGNILSLLDSLRQIHAPKRIIQQHGDATVARASVPS